MLLSMEVKLQFPLFIRNIKCTEITVSPFFALLSFTAIKGSRVYIICHTRTGLIMVTGFVNDLAKQMNIPVTEVNTKESSGAGCLGVHLLNISFEGKVVNALMYQKELDDL
jgi:hypothetical protein